jgi:hypothetical protein
MSLGIAQTLEVGAMLIVIVASASVAAMGLDESGEKGETENDSRDHLARSLSLLGGRAIVGEEKVKEWEERASVERGLLVVVQREGKAVAFDLLSSFRRPPP